MFRLAKPFFLMTETPLHAGSGQDLGIVDMPIQRERHTGFPKIEGSGLKGCIREAFEEYLIKDQAKEDDKERITFEINPSLMQKLGDELFNTLKQEWKVKSEGKKEIHYIKFDEAISLAFGPEEGDAHAGALGFTDARILLFPVKSMKGVFAWISCPMVLEIFKEDLGLCGIQFKNGENEIVIPDNKGLKTTDGKGKCMVADKDEIGIRGNVILEEYAFEIQNNEIKDLAEFLANSVSNGEIKNKLVILSDEDFCDFVNLSTEVITRTKIDNITGTVQNGALFTEEYLPSETVMYSLVLTTPIFNTAKGIFEAREDKKEEELVMEFFEKGIPEIIQIGGNATIGKGITRIEPWGDSNE